MTPTEHLNALKARLLTEKSVRAFTIVRERATEDDGYLRARAILIDESQLEFAEYVQLTAEDQMVVVTYSYHWSDAIGELIHRWDNTPHYPNLANFPHHQHVGPTEIPEPSQPMNLAQVLEEINRRLGA